MAIFVAAYSAGAAQPLTEPEAENIRTSFIEDVQNIDQFGIFLNNAKIAVAMFIPGAGVGIGVFSGFSTGTVFHAFAMISPEVAGMHPLSVLATPFGTLELLAYGLAVSRSGMLAAQLVKKEERTKAWKRYSLSAAIEIGLVVAALIAGSAIESQELADTG